MFKKILSIKLYIEPSQVSDNNIDQLKQLKSDNVSSFTSSTLYPSFRQALQHEHIVATGVCWCGVAEDGWFFVRRCVVV